MSTEDFIPVIKEIIVLLIVRQSVVINVIKKHTPSLQKLNNMPHLFSQLFSPNTR
jgi:hypothetical protein